MIDLVAGTAVIIGGILAVLAGVGLLRFPDALTRLHAAAKTATVGVITATVAAALEVDTVGAAALLVLVVVLLFLSAPLGSSLLARAAYYDPDTPVLLPGRDDLATTPATPGSTAGGERRGAAALLIGWLLVVWVALFASGTPGVLMGAVAVAGAVSLLLPGYRPRWPRGILKPIALARFTVRFFTSLWSANLDVARSVLSRRALRASVVRFPLRVTTDTEVTLLMNAVTFTPGTVALEVTGRDLFVHVLDLRDEDAFRKQVERLESDIIDAFGTPGERALTAET